MKIPEEITYKIFSYLPGDTLVTLNLSNKQYWNIYRMKNKKCPWNEETIWLEKLLDTSQMYLKDHVYVHTFHGLCSVDVNNALPGEKVLTNTPEIPVKEGVVFFKSYLNGYVWHPEEAVDFIKIKQILNEHDKTIEKIVSKFLSNDDTNNSTLTEQIASYLDLALVAFEDLKSGVGNESNAELGVKWAKNHIKKHMPYGWETYQKFKKAEVDSARLLVPLIFYLKDKFVNWAEEELTLTEPIEIKYEIVFKVMKKIKKTKEERDIGRAVLSSQLHDMILKSSLLTWKPPRSNIGVALFANNDNTVYGFGNFDCNKPVDVFRPSNFSIIKADSFEQRPDSDSEWDDMEEEEEEDDDDFFDQFPWENSEFSDDDSFEEEEEWEESEEGDLSRSCTSSLSDFCLTALFDQIENINVEKDVIDLSSLFFEK